MKITQIREKEDAEALSVLDFDLLMEKIKTETKTRPVTGLRQALHFVLPGEPCSFAGKLPKIMPAAVFGRVNGVRRMKVYNGIVELTVGPLAGKVEVELVKKKAADLPQTMFAYMGSSGNSVKIWTLLPSGRNIAANTGRSGTVSGTCLSFGCEMLSAADPFRYPVERAAFGAVFTAEL